MLLLHEVDGVNWQVMNFVHDKGEALIFVTLIRLRQHSFLMCLFWSTQHLHLVVVG